MANAMIQASHLSKAFALGGQWIYALDNLTFAVPQGQFVAIMGTSGSGKSTLLYLLGGLEPASAGDICIAGQRLDALNRADLATFRSQTIGFIFQSFHLVPTMTALENVALPGVFTGMPADEREERAYRLLIDLKMSDRVDHRPNQLSGGQQQRVAIARALFNDPPILMADEPTGSLDSHTGTSVMQMLHRLCHEQGKTILVVTHDPSIARYAHRQIDLKDGQMIADIPVRTQFKSEEIA